MAVGVTISEATYSFSAMWDVCNLLVLSEIMCVPCFRFYVWNLDELKWDCDDESIMADVPCRSPPRSISGRQTCRRCARSPACASWCRFRMRPSRPADRCSSLARKYHRGTSEEMISGFKGFYCHSYLSIHVKELNVLTRVLAHSIKNYKVS